MRVDGVPKVSFWPYDVFGYLFPGAALIAGIALGDSKVSDGLRALWGAKELGSYALLTGICYITGTAVAAVSSVVLEGIVLRNIWKYPAGRMFPENMEEKKGWMWDCVHVLADMLVPRYRDALAPEFRELVDTTMREVYGDKWGVSHNRFWLCWEYVALHHPAAHRRATHFLELYGFSRNASMSFLLLAGLPVLSGWLIVWKWLIGWGIWTAPTTWSLWTVPCLLVAVIFFANYAKLIRRLDDEVFHAFVVAVRAPLDGPPAGASRAS